MECQWGKESMEVTTPAFCSLSAPTFSSPEACYFVPSRIFSDVRQICPQYITWVIIEWTSKNVSLGEWLLSQSIGSFLEGPQENTLCQKAASHRHTVLQPRATKREQTHLYFSRAGVQLCPSLPLSPDWTAPMGSALGCSMLDGYTSLYLGHPLPLYTEQNQGGEGQVSGAVA